MKIARRLGRPAIIGGLDQKDQEDHTSSSTDMTKRGVEKKGGISRDNWREKESKVP